MPRGLNIVEEHVSWIHNNPEHEIMIFASLNIFIDAIYQLHILKLIF